MKKFLFVIVWFILFFIVAEFLAYSVLVYKQKQIVFASKVFKFPDNYKYSFKTDTVHTIINYEPNYRKLVSFGNRYNILILGCSYAYGTQLDEEDSFGYKLAKKLNSTVYNRSFPGFGLQHMYYQILNNKIEYKNIDVVIYVNMYDHINRLYSCYWASPFENYLNIRYRLKEGKLEEIPIRFPYIENLFIVKAIREVFFNIQSKSKNFKSDSSTLFIALLNESQKKIKEKYPNARFILLEYLDGNLVSIKNEINDSGWEYISTTDILPENIDLSDEKYHFYNDPHPIGEAWEVISNAIIEKQVLH